MFQDPISSLNPRKTIRQVMEAPLKYAVPAWAAPTGRRASPRSSPAVNLRPEFLDRYPHEFSGGQAQRIGIARALLARPKIIVLDEPVSALDVSVQAQVLNLLARLRAEYDLTYLFISHDLAVVEAVSDRVAVLYFGKVVEIGPAEAIFAHPRHPYTRLLADSAPVVGRPLAVRDASETELPDPLNPPPGCPFAARCPRVLDRCRTEEPQLADDGEMPILPPASTPPRRDQPHPPGRRPSEGADRAAGAAPRRPAAGRGGADRRCSARPRARCARRCGCWRPRG